MQHIGKEGSMKHITYTDSLHGSIPIGVETITDSL